MSHVEKNIEAEKTFLKTYSDKYPGKTLQELDQVLNPADFIAYLRLLGLGCSKCGKFVSGATLQFYDYDVTKVLCYTCQENN